MCLGFLPMDVADEVGVGSLVVLGDLGLLDKKYCAGAFDLFGSGATYTEAMGEKLTPFICKGAFPDSCVGTEEELGNEALFAGCGWSGGESGDMMIVPLVSGALG
jgi:hypothetical protein